MLVHRFLYHKHKLPEVFSKCFTLNRSVHFTQQEQDMTYIPQVRIHPEEKIIKFKASQQWNELPTQLKTIMPVIHLNINLKVI